MAALYCFIPSMLSLETLHQVGLITTQLYLLQLLRENVCPSSHLAQSIALFQCFLLEYISFLY